MEESITGRMTERLSGRHKAVPGKTYRVEVCDYHSDEEACKTLTLPVEYPDIESAGAAGRELRGRRAARL
nr:MAG TPA: hypothetical protein [Caudoviricetes sp.]